MAKFLITGKNGMLAYAFQHDAYFADNTAFSHQDLDVSDFENVEKVIKKERPKFLINCAAYTDVTSAENDMRKALSVNFQGVGNLAKVCKKYNVFLVHFSTDYVFPGNTGKSFKEDDNTNPINQYGLSKLAGETKIMSFLEDFLIIRISWLYGPQGNNFVSIISKLIQERELLNIVSDQYGKTTYTFEVTAALKNLLEQNKKGIYHVANHGYCSRYEFTKEIYELMKLNDPELSCEILPISNEDWDDSTPRPCFSVLNTSKYERETESKLRAWKDALKDYLALAKE